MIQFTASAFKSKSIEISSFSQYFATECHANIWGCASSRISNWRASCGHGLNQVANHLLWDGHPLLKCLEQLLMQMCRFVHSPSNTSVQLVPDLLDWAGQKARNESGHCCCYWQETAKCGRLHYVWGCRVETQHQGQPER